MQEARSQAEAIRELLPVTVAAGSATGGQCKKIKSSVVLKEPQVRGKSALLFFRDDFLENQRQILAGSVVNPCSKEFWSELKQAWAALPRVKQSYYEELSMQSLQKAAVERNAKKKKQKQDAAPVACSATCSEVSHPAAAQADLSPLSLSLPAEISQQLALALPFNPWTLAARASSCANIPELAEDIRMFYSSSSSSDFNLADEFLTCSPVSEDQLQSNWQHNVQKGVTWAQALNHFNIQAQRFSLPPSDDKFPDRVTYQSCCGCLCRSNASPQDLFLFVKLLNSFEGVIKQCGNGSAPSAASCDILLRFSFFSEEDEVPRRDMYAWMTAFVRARNCTQNFILMSVAPESSPDCLKLKLASQAAIRHELKWCSSLLQSGPLCHFSGQEFAKHLLGMFHESCACAVVVTRLAFQDVDLCTVIVEGSWDSWKDLTVRFAGQQPVGEEDEQPGDAPAVADDALPESSDQPNQGNHFDLLAEISGGSGVRKQGKGKGRGRGTTSELRRGLVAALPFDPTVHQELQREFEQFLADEHVQPELVLPDRPACSEIERALRDPAIAASLDAAAAESVLKAVESCRQADPDLEVAFDESGDDDIVEDSMDPTQEPPDAPAAGGIGSPVFNDESDDAGAADDVAVPCL